MKRSRKEGGCKPEGNLVDGYRFNPGLVVLLDREVILVLYILKEQKPCCIM